jgi:SSS family solute:Na+ symporter
VKQHTIAPVGIFFDQVARIDPKDPASAKVGLGRFHAEIWLLSWFGIDFSGFSKPQLVAIRFLFDALFPFVLLFVISFVTRPVPQAVLDHFFAKMHTPVQKTPQEEEKELADSYANPDKYKRDKLFRNSQWEILKPGKMDYVGFFGSWLLVGVVILLLWGMVSVK